MDHEPREATTRARRRWVKTFGLFLLGMAGLFALLCGALTIQINREHEGWLAKLRDAGYSATMEEFVASYGPIPEAEDAAPLYEIAIELSKSVDPNGMAYSAAVGLRNTDGSGEGASPDDPYEASVRAQVALVADVLEATREAALRPRARFDIKLSLGPAAELGHLAPMRQLARLVALDAEVATWDGDGGRAADDIVTILGIARALEEEPILISSFVSIAIQDYAVQRVPALLGTDVLTEAELQRLDDAFAREPYWDMFHNALSGEFNVSVINAPSYTGISPMARAVGAFPEPFRRVWLRYEANVMMDYAAEPLFAPPMPWHELLDLAEREEAKGMRPSILARMVVPDVAQSAEAFARATANGRIVRVAIAVERFRRAKGRLPYDIDELAPAFPEGLPVDPFDGKLIRYVPTATGYTVYSVFLDRIDGHGAIRQNVNDPDWGIAVELEREQP